MYHKWQQNEREKRCRKLALNPPFQVQNPFICANVVFYGNEGITSTLTFHIDKQLAGDVTNE